VRHMRTARTPRSFLRLAFLGAFLLLVETAFAAGSIAYSKKEVQESGGGWHLMMTIVYGGKRLRPTYRCGSASRDGHLRELPRRRARR